jgi:mRNA interferase MazF
MIRQGELGYLDFDPSAGHEPAKRCPALVLSVDGFNAYLSSLIVVCPLTATPSAYPLHVPVGDGYSVGGYVCVEQMAAVDPVARRFETTGEMLDERVMGEILELVASVFGL